MGDKIGGFPEFGGTWSQMRLKILIRVTPRYSPGKDLLILYLPNSFGWCMSQFRL